MELRVLRYFLAVVREGSITGAAESLHVTQPTLSRQLKDLEDELGQELFVRRKRRISLTESGKLLRQRAQEIMEMVEKTESELNSVGKAVEGSIYIGSGETEAMKLLAQVMNDIQGQWPGIRFHMYSGAADDVMEKIDKGSLDFGLVIQPANTAKYDTLDLHAHDYWGVIMRRDHPLAQKEFVTPVDLIETPLILSSRQLERNGPGVIGYPEWFGPYWNRVHVAATYNLIHNAALMVQAGIGCALSLDHIVNVAGTDDLCFRLLVPHVKSSMSIIWKKYQVFSPAAKIFLARLREKLEDLPAPA